MIGPKPMFLCISPNPAIDKRLTLPQLVPGRVHRASTVCPLPGGKAAHVATSLHLFGANPIWLGFVGGSTGEYLIRGLQALDIEVRPVPMREATRVNLEIIEENGTITEILEPGAEVSELELLEFEQKCLAGFEEAGSMGAVIFSGSLPAGAPNDIYASLLRQAHRARCVTFLDTSGEALQSALASHPSFVKPNRQEAEALTGLAVRNRQDAIQAARCFMELGALSAALSLGEEGIVWIPENDSAVYFGSGPKVSVRSTVGCGDATIAAFALARVQGLSSEDTLRLAVACGAANCLAEFPGRLRAVDVEKLKSEVRIERLV